MNEDFINKWTSQLKKGTLSFIVLSILSREKEYYGYDLISEIKKVTDIDIAEGTLYPLLIRLKKSFWLMPSGWSRLPEYQENTIRLPGWEWKHSKK